jgi:hypothetical protein
MKTAQLPGRKWWDLLILKLRVNVRGKVTAGGFRMELMRIGCIEIDRRILKEPRRGP